MNQPIPSNTIPDLFKFASNWNQVCLKGNFFGDVSDLEFAVGGGVMHSTAFSSGVESVVFEIEAFSYPGSYDFEALHRDLIRVGKGCCCAVKGRS